MEYLEAYTDSRWASFCVHCFGLATTVDHVPPRIFLDADIGHTPKVPSCHECNRRASLDEQYVACLIEAAICGSVDAEVVRRPKIAGTFLKKPLLAARINEAMTDDGQAISVAIESERVERVFAKIARGLYAYETGEPAELAPVVVRHALVETLTDPEVAHFRRVDTALLLLSEIGSRQMQRIVGSRGLASPWITVQAGRFEYAVDLNCRPACVKFVISDFVAVEVAFPSDSRR